MDTQSVVVVVEDDPHIAELLQMYLQQSNFKVVRASTGEEGLQAAKHHDPVMVLLDIGLPGELDGFGVLRELRANKDTPVMILTAREEEIDRLLGLELGADDYVLKPFSPREVVARVKAILRRSRSGQAPAEVHEFDTIRIDSPRREVTLEQKTVAMTTREFDLLVFLAENSGLALSRQQLLDGVWGPQWYGDERTVDVHVRQLRKKLGETLPLETVWGIGYRLA